MLRNQVYVGDIVWNRETSARCVRWLDGGPSQRLAVHVSRTTGERTAHERNAPEDHIVLIGRHEPLISRELFAAAQAVIERRNRREGLETKRTRPLIGLLFCGSCGARMYSKTVHAKGRIYRYYACVADPADSGHKTRVRGDLLDHAILVALRRCLARPVAGGVGRRKLRKLLGELEDAFPDGDDLLRQQGLLRAFVERVTIRESQRKKRCRGRARKLDVAELVVREGVARPIRIDLLPSIRAWPRDARGGYAAARRRHSHGRGCRWHGLRCP